MDVAEIFPQVREDIRDAMYASRLHREDWRRSHLGASLLGHDCDRAVWLSFRWALKPSCEDDGRMQRLFSRGHQEEARIAEDLEQAGWEVKESEPVAFGAHVGGTPDLLATSPEGDVWLIECKTSNTKDFKQLEKKGIQLAKPRHYTQAQIYMRGTNIDRCLYICVCKETDDVYVEEILPDEEFIDARIARGQRIALLDVPPERINKDPAFFKCKMCDYHGLCHGHRLPEVNCRTCVSVTCTEDGWTCERGHDVDRYTQREGCREHLWNYELVPYAVEDADPEGNWVKYANGMVNAIHQTSAALKESFDV